MIDMSDDVGRAVIADLCRIPNPESIDRTTYVDLGGVSQFVSIRGRSTRNQHLKPSDLLRDDR